MTADETTGNGGAVQTLQALIRARMDERGWSYSDLAHRTGDELTRGRWQQLGTGVRMDAAPKPRTVRLIARALEVEETAVWLAVGMSLGLDVRRNGPALAQLMPAGTDQLSPEVRDAILAVIRATVSEALIREGDDESRHADTPGPSVFKWAKTGRGTGQTGQQPAQRASNTSGNNGE